MHHRGEEALLDTIKFDHGYTRDSAAVSYLVRVLAALDTADQRRFLRFVTGSPRLPPGGIAALKVSHTPHLPENCKVRVYLRLLRWS